jgi:hypothetical protein
MQLKKEWWLASQPWDNRTVNIKVALGFMEAVCETKADIRRS